MNVKILEQGLIREVTDSVFSYNGWPSIIRSENGALIVAYSGGRIGHLCMFGKEYVQRSLDDGKTWSNPILAYDSPLDDRDSALVKMPGNKIALNFFTKGKWNFENEYKKGMQEQDIRLDNTYLAMLPDDIDEKYVGRFVCFSEDDGLTWSAPVRVPVFTPGGFRLLDDGTYLCVSQRTAEQKKTGEQRLDVYKSSDSINWEKIAQIPVCENGDNLNHFEPEIVQLADGTVLCMIRMENKGFKNEEEHLFTLASSFSYDRGKTWSIPKLLYNDGAPAGLLEHSSGCLTCVYASRKSPYGIKVMLSEDSGVNWHMDFDLYTPETDDIPTGSHSDLGYPKTAELQNGDLLTVYYSKEKNTRKAAIRFTRWCIQP